MKSILLIGLGRFGCRMAKKFRELKHDVLAIDNDEQRVNEALDFVTSAQIADATSESFIRSLGVRDFDLCVVAIGDDFQSSLETCCATGQTMSSIRSARLRTGPPCATAATTSSTM